MKRACKFRNMKKKSHHFFSFCIWVRFWENGFPIYLFPIISLSYWYFEDSTKQDLSLSCLPTAMPLLSRKKQNKKETGQQSSTSSHLWHVINRLPQLLAAWDFLILCVLPSGFFWSHTPSASFLIPQVYLCNWWHIWLFSNMHLLFSSQIIPLRQFWIPQR